MFVGSDALFGKVGGADLASRIVLLLAAVLGAGYFVAAGSRPRLALRLLLAAIVAAVIGFGLLIAVRYGGA